jgi:hypothetical protein
MLLHPREAGRPSVAGRELAGQEDFMLRSLAEHRTHCLRAHFAGFIKDPLAVITEELH